jgi:hypothetical protein
MEISTGPILALSYLNQQLAEHERKKHMLKALLLNIVVC